MARKILFDISQLKSERLQGIADSVDMESRKKYRDGKIDEKEAKKLRELLSGKAALVEQESDDIKEMLGFSKSSATQPQRRALEKGSPELEAQRQQAVQHSEEASQAAPAPVVEEKEEKTPYEEVREAFDKARGYDAKSNTYAKTIDEAYKAVKKDDAFSDKKYKKALKQLKYDRKHSIADAEAQEVRRRASLAVDDKLNFVNPNALGIYDEDDARNVQIDYIKAQNGGKVDKRVKKALRNKNQSALKNFGLWFSGNYSAGKQDDISVAHLNKAGAIANKKYTKEEVLDIVGSEEMLNNYMAAGLVKYDENTKEYDIKNLSLLYLNSVGADATINEHDVNVEAETQAFRTKLHIASGFKLPTENISNDEVLRLGDKLGFYDNHYHGKFVRTWQKATEGLAKGAIIGAAAGARNTKTNVDLEQHQEVSINMDGFTAEDRAKLLNGISTDTALTNEPVTVLTEEGFKKTTFGQVTETVAGIYITQDQMMNVSISSLWKHVGLGAAIGAAVGTGFGIIDGLTSKGREKECFGLTADCDSIKTYEQLVSVIDNAYPDADLKPEQKAALKKIAILGYQTEWVTDDKTGKRYERFVMVRDANGDCKPVWDWCTFYANYNKYRGNQIFNANELRMASALTQNRLSEIRTEDCAPKKPVDPPKKEETKKPECPTCGLDKKDIPVETEGFKHYFKYGYGDWTNIIKAYYDYDCIADEARKAGYKKVTVFFKHEICRKEDGSYDEAKFQELKAGKIPPYITLPDKIGDCELNRNGKVEFKQPVGAPKGYTGGISVKSKGTETEVTDCKGRKGRGKDLDSAIKDINRKLPAGTDPYTRSDVKK